jgi:hypothetical protein
MNKKLIETVLEIVVILVTAIFAFISGIGVGIKKTHKAAIQAGVAHYTVNPTNGITQFEFKAAK